MRYVLLILLFGLTCSVHFAPSKTRIKVVIDPGHGGNDPGHLSHSSKFLPEKDINLKIAKLVGGYMDKYLSNVDIYYTRTDDTYPSLDQRVDLANNNNVDYFISIHCNGNAKKSVHGTESHIHNFDARQSYKFALELEKQFSQRAGRYSRGVKNNDDRAHSIQVLKFTRMTSVLVECGFMTNHSEAAYLNSSYGQEILASAIFRAFRTRAQADFPTVSLLEPGSSGAYTIQIMSSKGPIDTQDASFRKLESPVKRIKLNTSNSYKYKYVVGSYSTKKEAEGELAKVRKNGFPDAIVVEN